VEYPFKGLMVAVRPPENNTQSLAMLLSIACRCGKYCLRALCTFLSRREVPLEGLKATSSLSAQWKL